MEAKKRKQREKDKKKKKHQEATRILCGLQFPQIIMVRCRGNPWHL